MSDIRSLSAALLGVAALSAGLAPNDAGAADACTFPSGRSVAVGLERRDGEVVLDNRRSREDLRAMQTQSGKAGAFGAGWTPVGLTLTELKYGMRVKVEAFPASGGGYCARLTEVAADIGFDRMNVFIADRFRPGTCAYTSISEHEMTHVAVFRQTLDVYHPRMQRRLERAANNLGAVRAASAEAAASALQKALRAAVDPLFSEMNRTMDRNNAQLDTPQRYRAEQSRCPEW